MATASTAPWVPVICVVGFHHARGPEIETWFGVPDGTDPAVENDWTFLSFMALSDGAHALEEDFSYFTLRCKATETQPASSLFGMSCTRQLDARELIDRPDDVTRSTVQKSVVIVARSPHVFTAWREKLSLVTRAWFLQRDFTKTSILKDFQENLVETELNTSDEARDHYVGISLREFIHEFKHQALVMFKCCLLQPKMLFFSTRCERLCMIQFALISLIPGLIKALQDCADPELDTYASTVAKPTSFKTSDRQSLLAYVGLPVQIFGKGSLFGPYTPLQQLDVLADFGTKSYIVGSTNSLLLQQKDRYSDIIVNLDDSTVVCSSPSLQNALRLTAADRRWIDLMYGDIAADWDPDHPTRPRNMGFKGSEEYIRILFEQYIIALLSSVKFHIYFNSLPAHKRSLSAFPDYEYDPSSDFGDAWVEAWQSTPSFALWSKLTDPHLFDLVDPRHPTAGGFTVDDFNRRLAHELQELHLDERFATSKEALSKSLAHGHKKVSAAINNIWADLEARRAARTKSPSRPQGKDGDAADLPIPDPTAASNLSVPVGGASAGDSTATATSKDTATTGTASSAASGSKAPDLATAQAALVGAGAKAGAYLSSLSASQPGQKAGAYLSSWGTSATGQKAGAYFSSWGSWASDKKKTWGRPKEEEVEAPPRNVGVDDSITLGARSFEAMLAGPQKNVNRPPPAEATDTEPKGIENEKPQSLDKPEPTSPKSPKSPKKEKRRSVPRAEVGADGIGRLDA